MVTLNGLGSQNQLNVGLHLAESWLTNFFSLPQQRKYEMLGIWGGKNKVAHSSTCMHMIYMFTLVFIVTVVILPSAKIYNPTGLALDSVIRCDLGHSERPPRQRKKTAKLSVSWPAMTYLKSGMVVIVNGFRPSSQGQACCPVSTKPNQAFNLVTHHDLHH